MSTQAKAANMKKRELLRGKMNRQKHVFLSGNKRNKKRPLTKFEEYLALEQQKGAVIGAEEDLELERRLAKRLKLKNGVLSGSSDGLSDLLEGMVCASDIQEKQVTGKKRDKKKSESSGGSEARDFDEELASSEEDELNGIDNDTEDDLDEEDANADIESTDGEIGRYGSESEPTNEEEDGGPGLSNDDENKEDTIIGEITEQNEGCHAARVVKGEYKKSKLESDSSSAKYVAPHCRTENNLLDDLRKQLQRRARGLLNRLSEENVESIAADIFSLFQAHGRRLMSEIIIAQVLEAVSSGPRGNEQYAAVFAAFLAATAASIGMDFGAKFLASFAASFEEQRKKEDSLSVRNMLLLFSYLYTFKLVSCDVVYDLLASLSRSLTELDVAMILTVLQTCGMGLRADDPAAMKDFVLSVQCRHEELKTIAAQNGTTFSAGKRMQFMLETISEIKDNKKRAKQETSPHVRLKKWLQKLGIEEVQLRALKWKKLLEPDKKGQWWICGGDVDQEGGENSDVADFIRKETVETEKMLKLAASQKMNTEIRKAIFCVVMSAEDYLDAFEKLLRIKLTGKQDREIMRVIVECCLQEKFFNKYYSLLINKLCHHDKNQRFTLQYCLWDHFKQLGSMETRRLANLAHLLADLIATFSLSLAVLKVVEFGDSKAMIPRAILFYSITLKVLLTAYSDDVVRNVFARIATSQELEGLRLKLSVFLYQHVMKGLQKEESNLSDKNNLLLLKRFALAKKAMTSTSVI